MNFGNPLSDEFFEEFEDDEQTTVVFSGVILALIFFLATILPNPVYSGVATLYLIYLVFLFFAIAFDYHFPDSKFITVDFAGGSIEQALTAMVIGGIAFVIYLIFIYRYLTAGAIAVPTIATTAVIFGIPAVLIFKVLVAPFAEEVFRIWFLPQINLWLGSFTMMGYFTGMLAGFIQAILFGWAHAAVVGGSSSMMELFVFGFISGNLNYLCQSSMASVGFHFVRNIIAVSQGG